MQLDVMVLVKAIQWVTLCITVVRKDCCWCTLDGVSFFSILPLLHVGLDTGMFRNQITTRYIHQNQSKVCHKK